MDVPDSAQTKEEAVKSWLSKLSGKTPQSILNDTDGTDLETLRQEGSDLNILTYAFNYKVNGVLEQDLDKVNAFNEKIYDGENYLHGKIYPMTDICKFCKWHMSLCQT